MAGDLDPLEQHLVTALRALSAEDGGPPVPDEAEAAWRADDGRFGTVASPLARIPFP